MQPGEPGVNAGSGWGDARKKEKRREMFKRGREWSGNRLQFWVSISPVNLQTASWRCAGH